jgi:hypothetical protein
MKAICASENFDLFMVLPGPRPESLMPLNWNFPAKIGPANREQVKATGPGAEPSLLAQRDPVTQPDGAPSLMTKSPTRFLHELQRFIDKKGSSGLASAGSGNDFLLDLRFIQEVFPELLRSMLHGLKGLDPRMPIREP